MTAAKKFDWPPSHNGIRRVLTGFFLSELAFVPI
jgi:hypothetical protein